MLKWRRESALDVFNLLLALFLFATPWLFAYANEDAKIDLWVSGVLIAAISLATFFVFSYWEEWLNVVLGVWLGVSPWVLGFAHTRAMHYSIGIGAAVAYLAALEMWLVHDASSEKRSVSPKAGEG